jgi:endonuclease-3 related protein
MEPMHIYMALLERFGKQGWWPASSRFEVVVGAILTQNTNWRNVEKAVANLRKAGILNQRKISRAKKRRIEALIRPSGFYRQKAGRLKSIARWFISADLKMSTERLREELLAIKGVGKETADSIILYAFNKPVFVIDAYTRRMCDRHGLVKGDDYEDYRSFFEKNLPKDVELYKEFHALIVELGKRYCKKRPECEKCPVFSLA